MTFQKKFENKQTQYKPCIPRLFSLGSSLSTSLASSEVVGTHSLSTRSQHHIHVSAVVLLSLLHIIMLSTIHLP